MPVPDQNEKPEKTSKIRILSIDGGGIRGILPATILQHVEEEIGNITGNKNARLGEYVDMIAGTSTGGILACLYLTPVSLGAKQAKFRASDAVDLYMKNGKDIFHKNFWENFSNFPLWNERFNVDQMQKLLDQYFGDLKLSDLIRPCVISSYDFSQRKAVFFNSTDARKVNGDIKNFYLKNITRATSAAPTYFEPANIKSIGGGEFNLIDGGVFVNNPAMCAYSEARNTEFSKDPVLQNIFKYPKPDKPSAKDMFHVSIGTGSESKKFKFEKLKDAGLISWLPVLIDIMMSGNSETVDYHLKKIYETLDEENRVDYIRLSPSLNNAKSDMDNVSKKNLDNLYEAGNKFVYENTELLNSIAKKLVQYS